MTADAIARQYLGVRFRAQGRTSKGLDCIGLIVVVASEMVLPFDDVTNYSQVPTDQALKRALDQYLTPLVAGDHRPGDVLYFGDGATFRHVGIASTLFGKPAMIHAYLKRRKVVETYLSDFDAPVQAAYRIIL